MTDEPVNPVPRDRSRIDIEEPWEMAYWTEQFGLPAETIIAAVNAVGPRTADVANYLGKTV